MQKHSPTQPEIAAQLRAAKRSLRDAALDGLSSEGRFQLAYASALDLATIAVLASGYRINARVGHHQLTFEAAALALASGDELFAFFDACRRRRNIISYEGQEIGAEFSTELLAETSRFMILVEGWLDRNYQELL